MRISDWSSDVCSSDLFDVRRPTELADRLDPIECIATLYQFLCIACKRTGITRNISNLWHHRLRQRGRLVAGTRTRRIEHHRLEPPEFVGGQRAAIQIAMLDEYRPLRARGRRLEAKAGVTRGLRGVDLADRKSTRLNSSH